MGLTGRIVSCMWPSCQVCQQIALGSGSSMGHGFRCRGTTLEDAGKPHDDPVVVEGGQKEKPVEDVQVQEPCCARTFFV